MRYEIPLQKEDEQSVYARVDEQKIFLVDRTGNDLQMIPLYDHEIKELKRVIESYEAKSLHRGFGEYRLE